MVTAIDISSMTSLTRLQITLYGSMEQVFLRGIPHVRIVATAKGFTARRAKPWPDLIYAESLCKVCTGESRNYEP